MTEEEWLAATDPSPMLEFLKTSNRKLMLFSTHCCRRIWLLIRDPASRRAVEMIERFIEEPIADQEYNAVYRAAREAAGNPDEVNTGDIDHHPGTAAYRILTLTPKSSFVINAVATASHAARAADEKVEEKAQIEFIRDIFGNPFRPVTFDPTWLTSTVTTLAQAMYDSKDFSTMPILADALQDSGCCDEQILSHCRGPGPHVRGCFLIDLILKME